MIRPLVARKRQASKNQVATEKAGWFRKSMKFFLGIPLLAICGLLINYKYHESEDLRNNLYRPLYTELSKIENDIQQDGMMLSFQTTTKASLEEKGELNRLPIALRTKVQTAYTDAASLLGNMSIIEAVQRATSIEAAKIRTKAIDEEWTHRTVAKMNKEALAKPGASIISSFTFTHPGTSPGFDPRVERTRYVTPGSINWLFDDWVDYPGSIDTVDRLWNDEQFLTFDNAREDWHFRITREDLKKHQLTLREFIAPIHDALEKSTDVKQVKQRRTQVAAN